jgi:hypothetical protein
MCIGFQEKNSGELREGVRPNLALQTRDNAVLIGSYVERTAASTTCRQGISALHRRSKTES